MPLASYDYDYDYEYEYRPRKRVATVYPQGNLVRKKAIYNYEAPIKDEFKVYKDDYLNIPAGIHYKKRKVVKEARKSAFNIESNISKKPSFRNKPETIAADDVETSKDEKHLKGRAEKVLKRINNAFLLVCGVALLFLILYRSSLINEKFNQVEKAKKQLANSQTLNEQIQAEIDSETDLSYIENYAKYQLGMQKPQTSQIVYINLEKTDRVITPTSLVSEEEPSWYTKLANAVIDIFE
jgi:cell division protein FtsL